MPVAANQDVVRSGIQKMQDTMISSVFSQLESYKIQSSDYGKVCVMNALSSIQELLDKSGITIKDVDMSQLTVVLQRVAMLELNTANAECYFELRSAKVNNSWTKKLNFGIQGNGNQKILIKFGSHIQAVGNPWLVRETDEFQFPSYTGFDGIVPPKWTPSGKGKVIRVVYPIKKTDGTIDFLTAEREDVAHNLKAHILNNMTKADKSDPEANKKARNDMFQKLSDMTLDQMLADETLAEYISPAWRSPASSESMIIRKMMNNAVKDYPKEFNKQIMAEAYSSTYDDYDQYKDKDSEDVIDQTAKAVSLSGKQTLQISNVQVTKMPDLAEKKPIEAKEEEQGVDTLFSQKIEA